MKHRGILLFAMAVVLTGCSSQGETTTDSKGATGKSAAGQSSVSYDDPVLDATREAASKQMQVAKDQVPVDVPVGALKPPMDDLDIIEVVMALEDKFKITISDHDLTQAEGVAKGAKADLPKTLTLNALADLVKRVKKSK